MVRWDNWVLWTIITIVGLFVVFLVFTEPVEETSSAYRPSPTPRPAARDKDLNCLKDIQCASNKSNWQSAADRTCRPYIENLAEYSAKWTDGWDSIFDWVVLQPPDFKTLKYTGSKVEFQNVFGAWLPMEYECVYDPINEKVKTASINSW